MKFSCLGSISLTKERRGKRKRERGGGEGRKGKKKEIQRRENQIFFILFTVYRGGTDTSSTTSLFVRVSGGIIITSGQGRKGGRME